MKQTPDFDPQIRGQEAPARGALGSLATLMAGSGDPYCSLVNVATDADGSPLLLISAPRGPHQEHSRRPARVADARRAQGGRPARRRARHAEGHGRGHRRPQTARRRYLARQPEARDVRRLQGFCRLPNCADGRASGRRASAASSTSSPRTSSPISTDADALVEAEAEICAHMNDDHADAVRLYATKLLGAPDGDWRCVGCRSGRARIAERPHGVAAAVSRARARTRRAAASAQAVCRAGARECLTTDNARPDCCTA